MTTAEFRALLKRNHLCRDCRAQDAYTLAGRTYCAECAAKIAAAKRAERATPEGKAKDRATCERWRARKAAEGLCVYCGRRHPEAGRRLCAWRLAKHRRARARKREGSEVNWPRGANGYCWLCNKRKAMDGKRLCQMCYDGRVAALTPEAGAKGRATMKKWRTGQACP